MTIRRHALRLVAVPLIVGACTRTAAKSGDSATASSPDSAASMAPAPAAAVPTPPTADPGTKASPPPGGSAGTPAPTPTPTATPSETVLTGRLVVGGLASDQKTMLHVDGGTPTTLTGPLEPELKRLNAATVWVAGAPGSGSSFLVSRYDIVSIDGSKPAVGVLTSRDGATWLVTERDTVKLSAATPELRAKVGAKVWIVGRRTGAELTPHSFGVIREP